MLLTDRRGFSISNENYHPGEDSKENSKNIMELSHYNEFPQALYPEGLGKSQTTEYTQIEYNFLINKTDPDMQKPSFSMWFKDYTQFFIFENFISKSKKLYLHYFIPVSQDLLEKLGVEKFEGRAMVVVSKIEKTEIKDNNVLECKISFERLEPWSINKDFSEVIHLDDVGGKIYSHSFPYVYGSGGRKEIIVENMSNISAPLKIKMEADASNPAISLIDYDTGNIYNKIKILDSIVDEGDYFYLDSNVNSHVVMKSLNGTEINVWQKLDRDYDNALFLQPGKSIISYDNEFTPSGKVYMEWELIFDVI